MILRSSEERSATRREIGQLLWALLLFDLIVVGLGYMSRAFFEDWAFAVTVGLVALVTIAFLLILGVNLIIIAVIDVARWIERRRAGSRFGSAK